VEKSRKNSFRLDSVVIGRALLCFGSYFHLPDFIKCNLYINLQIIRNTGNWVSPISSVYDKISAAMGRAFGNISNNECVCVWQMYCPNLLFNNFTLMEKYVGRLICYCCYQFCDL
jgi:hypothetical protein